MSHGLQGFAEKEDLPANDFPGYVFRVFLFHKSATPKHFFILVGWSYDMLIIKMLGSKGVWYYYALASVANRDNKDLEKNKDLTNKDRARELL
jgi:hypothetical protein